MHSLEPEIVDLRVAGVIDEATAARAVALERGTLFSVVEELRVALYAAVAAITAGVGLLLKDHLERLGPVTLTVALAAVAAACYASALRTRLRHEARSLGGDYLLLLGALLLSADLGYAEVQFHWLGSHWSWHLLILAALHGVTAYVFDSRLVLSVSLTALAGWFGIDAHVNGLFQSDDTLRHSALQALLCAAVVLAWRELHRRLRGASSLAEVLEHCAANLGFWGALAACFGPDTRLAGLALLLPLAVVTIRTGLRRGQEAFVIYGVAYTALGLCVLEARLVTPGLLASVVELATVIGAVTLLWRWHRQRKATAA